MSINEVKNIFIENLKTVDQIVETPSTVGTVAVDMLRALQKENEKLSGFIPYKQKLEEIISTIDKIKSHKVLKEQYQVIYNQATVLIISHFESFLSDIFKSVFDDYSYLMSWPDKKTQLDLNMLNYSYSPTLGEIIIHNLRAKGEVNFQDLQSTIRTFEEYLQMKPKFENSLIDDIIYYQALRNVIIHNSGKVDEKFLKQTRNLKTKPYNGIGDEIHITEIDFIKIKKVFNNAVTIITDDVNTRINELIPF